MSLPAPSCPWRSKYLPTWPTSRRPVWRLLSMMPNFRAPFFQDCKNRNCWFRDYKTGSWRINNFHIYHTFCHNPNRLVETRAKILTVNLFQIWAMSWAVNRCPAVPSFSSRSAVGSSVIQEGSLPRDAHLLTPRTCEYMLPSECGFKVAAGIRFSNLPTLK